MSSFDSEASYEFFLKAGRSAILQSLDFLTARDQAGACSRDHKVFTSDESVRTINQSCPEWMAASKTMNDCANDFPV
jgi:hypothetical protein